MSFMISVVLSQTCLRLERTGSRSRMRQLRLCVLLSLGAYASAWATAAVQATQWRSGLVELDQSWAEHDGDDLRWASTDFDDSRWNGVNLDDMGAAQRGWHWYRRHVKLGSDNTDMRFLLAGRTGTYELYVNGVRISDHASGLSWWSGGRSSSCFQSMMTMATSRSL